MSDELKKAIFSAIFDPGAEVGMKHDRSLTEWQTDAVMNVLDRVAQQKAPDASISDTDRLDFLDSLSAALNSHYGTKYGWAMVINHNVNRLMLNFPRGVDLNDAQAQGFPSCRGAIDSELLRVAAARRVKASGLAGVES